MQLVQVGQLNLTRKQLAVPLPLLLYHPFSGGMRLTETNCIQEQARATSANYKAR
jgi:hypothetical protein